MLTSYSSTTHRLVFKHSKSKNSSIIAGNKIKKNTENKLKFITQKKHQHGETVNKPFCTYIQQQITTTVTRRLIRIQIVVNELWQKSRPAKTLKRIN